jgi:DNA-binding MarR family transcriptional regulator
VSETPPVGLGVSLRQAWVGYRRQLEHELAAAGFGDRGFPDGRVLRLCTGGSEVTISQIGRELGITRQGASKIVASLRDRGYVALSPSPTDRREKIVKPTPRALQFLAAQREAARRIEARVHAELGDDALDALYQLLDALGTADQSRDTDRLHV